MEKNLSMKKIVLKSTVNPDGTLHLVLPVENAGQAVQITVEPLGGSEMSQGQWHSWVDSMAGSIEDADFLRPPQLPLEVRERLE